MNIAHVEEIKQYRYEVAYDEYAFFDLLHDKDLYFESEKERENYINKFRNEELFHFGVIKSSICECCKQWTQKDSLWGIDAQNPKSALKYYLENFNQGE